MIKFLEFNQRDLKDGQDFADGLNDFLTEVLSKSDVIISVKYKKYMENNAPASSVFLTVNTDVLKPEEIDNEKQLYFFELNEHEFADDLKEGRRFDEIMSSDFSPILKPEDDILAIEYDKYFYKGNIFSGVLLLANVKL